MNFSMWITINIAYEMWITRNCMLIFLSVSLSRSFPHNSMDLLHLSSSERKRIQRLNEEQDMEDVLENEYCSHKVEECSGKIVDGQGHMILRIL